MSSHVLKIGHLTDTKDFYSMKWGVRLFWLIADGSLVPRPLPDFILQPWKKSIFLHGCEIKSGRGLGTGLS